MTVQIDLRVVELLAARLCHDLIGPVSAVNNGAELLGEEDPDFVADAAALVGDSARKALRRLQFYRFAYGFSGGAAATAPHRLVDELFEEMTASCDYANSVRQLSAEWQKLACNMAAIAGEALPRGGSVRVTAIPGGVQMEAKGEGSLPAELPDALSLTTPVAELSSRGVVAYFAGLLAQALGCRIRVEAEPGGFRLVAAP